MNKRLIATTILLLAVLSPALRADDDDEDEDPRVAALEMDYYRKSGNIFTGLRADAAFTYRTLDKRRLFRAVLRSYLEEGHSVTDKDVDMGTISGTAQGYNMTIFLDRAKNGYQVKIRISFVHGSIPFAMEDWLKKFFVSIGDKL